MNTVLEERTNYVPTVDVTKLCFKEATSYPLLSEEEEKELFNQYSLAVMSIEQLQDPILTDSDRKQLNRLVKMGERARDILFNSNQRLVISIARGYLGRGLELMDLVQEGNMGLLKAIEKFDVTLGNKFSTYATYWIKQSIGRAITYQADAIRLPSYVAEQLNQVRNVITKLTIELEREPTYDEIGYECNLPASKVSELCSCMNKVSSLDEVVKEETTRGQLISDDSIPTPIEEAIKESRKEVVMNLLSELPYKEQQIIIMHYGLNDTPKSTLEEIGLKFDLTRERIRQLEHKALKTLRLKLKGLSLSEVF